MSFFVEQIVDRNNAEKGGFWLVNVVNINVKFFIAASHRDAVVVWRVENVRGDLQSLATFWVAIIFHKKNNKINWKNTV